jgi:uncharacterized metal-binding protein YceD (DUF177 family)
MKLDIQEIPEEGLTLELSVDETTVAELASLGSEGAQYRLLKPLKAHLKVSLAGSIVSVRGSLEAAISVNCSRCLKGFTHSTEPAFNLYYVRGAKEHEEREKELTAEEVEINYLEGDVLDTTELLLELAVRTLTRAPADAKRRRGLIPGLQV